MYVPFDGRNEVIIEPHPKPPYFINEIYYAVSQNGVLMAFFLSIFMDNFWPGECHSLVIREVLTEIEHQVFYCE